MSLADLRTEFLAHRIARRLARRSLFQEKTPGALASAVQQVFAREALKEKEIDQETRRMLDAARAQISTEGADSNELYRKIRKKLAEKKGIVL